MKRSVISFVAALSVALTSLLLAEDRPSPPARVAPATSPTDPAARLARVLPEFKLAAVPLAEACKYWSEVTGVNIWVDWSNIHRGDADRETPVSVDLQNVTAGAALKAILREAAGGALGYQIDEGVVVVTHGDAIVPPTLTHIYDVRDLILAAAQFSATVEERAGIGRRPVDGEGATTPPAGSQPPDPPRAMFGGGGGRAATDAVLNHEEVIADRLIAALRDGSNPEQWRDGTARGYATARYFAGTLIITHTADGHQRVAGLLKDLRANPALARPASPAAEKAK